MHLVLNCPSGIAGNIWIAGLLGLGADPGVLDDLPERLGVPHARIDWRYDARARCSEVAVRGAEASAPTDYRGLVARVHAARLSEAVRADALAVLHGRELAEARLLRVPLESRVFAGEEVADTLIDVVGGVLVWHALGAPVTTTSGPVIAGLRPRRSVLELLAGVPVERGGADLCLATPTGAALLGRYWQQARSGEQVDAVDVPGDFSRAAGLEPMQAALHAPTVRRVPAPTLSARSADRGERAP